MTSTNETPDDPLPDDQEPEPAAEPVVTFQDAVLRLVTAENLPAIFDAFNLAEEVAELIRDGIAETGFPVERVTFIAPSVGDDGRPVVWIHLSDADACTDLFATGGAGPPPPAR